ncbi:MAG: DUF6445 family protein [Dokdonella sp.]
MPTSLIVVDDFLQNAAELRAAALQLKYPDLQGTFPGRNSLERVPIEGLAQQVSRLVGEPLRDMSPPGSHAKFRITLAADVGRAQVHIDPAHGSGILYLSRAQDCAGDAEFLRRRATGSDRVALNAAELAAGYSSMDEMHREIIEKYSVDDSKWGRTMQVPMRFNRLVLLRPWLWHTAGPPFGDSLENGRLVKLMFSCRHTTGHVSSLREQ